MKKKIIGIVFFVLAIACVVSAAAQGGDNALLGGAAVGLVFALLGIRSFRQAKPLRKPQQKSAPAAKPQREAAPTATPSTSPSVPAQPTRPRSVTLPSQIDGQQAAYRYSDVAIAPLPDLDYNLVELGQEVSFSVENGKVSVVQGHSVLGWLREGQLADMVSDWLKRGDKMIAMPNLVDDDKKLVQLYIVFYKDLIALAKRKNAKAIKLVNNKNEEMQDSLMTASPGDLCLAAFDDDKDKWCVTCDSGEIGYLPASYSEDADLGNKNLVIAEIETDDNDKYTVSVYIV